MADNPKEFVISGSLNDVSKDRNPSPPPQLLENESAMADIINGTVVSKQWVLQTLLSAVKEVETDSSKALSEENLINNDEAKELDDNLECELSKLWDMSMESAVASFLMECNVPTTLIGLIIKSNVPRLTEISVGILANLVCNPSICQNFSENEDFVDVVLQLLANSDPQTVIETIRLASTCISTCPTANIWLKSIKSHETVLKSVIFIFESSTNSVLLEGLAQLVDTILDSDEEILTSWSQKELVAAILESFRQIGNSKPEASDTLCHILQLISVSPDGCTVISHYGNEISKEMEKYIKAICEQDFVDINGRQCGLASCIDVLAKIYLSNEINFQFSGSTIFGYLLQLNRLLSPIPPDLGNGTSNLNQVLIETLSNFWCNLLRFWQHTEYLLQTLDKAPEKDIRHLLKCLKLRQEFSFIEHLKESIDRSGAYNRLTEFMNKEINR
uniref:Uncharacterized protein n=1 Tax=Strigamia maritima TaxID=126957 RepID=T1IU97_STRMM